MSRVKNGLSAVDELNKLDISNKRNIAIHVRKMTQFLTLIADLDTTLHCSYAHPYLVGSLALIPLNYTPYAFIGLVLVQLINSQK